MTIGVMFDFSGFSTDVYDQVLEKVGPSIWKADGLIDHVCFRDGTGFRIVDVWEDEASFGVFGQTVIIPALASLGVEGPQPVVFPIHKAPFLENVATVAGIYEAFGRGDVPAILDTLADDVEWEQGLASSHGLPWLVPGQGKAHVASFFESLANLQITKFVPFSIAAHGANRVVALIDIEATIVKTGKSFADLEIHVWTFGPDGKVVAYRHGVDTARQVELSS